MTIFGAPPIFGPIQIIILDDIPIKKSPMTWPQKKNAMEITLEITLTPPSQPWTALPPNPSLSDVAVAHGSIAPLDGRTLHPPGSDLALPGVHQPPSRNWSPPTLKLGWILGERNGQTKPEPFWMIVLKHFEGWTGGFVGTHGWWEPYSHTPMLLP